MYGGFAEKLVPGPGAEICPVVFVDLPKDVILLSPETPPVTFPILPVKEPVG